MAEVGRWGRVVPLVDTPVVANCCWAGLAALDWSSVGIMSVWSRLGFVGEVE